MPLIYNLAKICAAQWLLNLRWWVLSRVLAKNDNLFHDRLGHLSNGDVIIGATVLDQAIDQNRLLSSSNVHFKDFAILAHQSARRHLYSVTLFEKINYNFKLTEIQ